MSTDFRALSLQSALRRLELAIDASGIGIWEHNVSDDSIVWDQKLRELYGLGDEQPITWLELVHPEDRAAASGDFERACLHGLGYSSQFRVVLPSGQIRHLRSKAHLHINELGQKIMIGAEWDVSVDVFLHQELVRQTTLLEQSRTLAEHAATHDYLTDLVNRRGLEEYLISESVNRKGAVSAVLHIDLDHFKDINDRYGHLAGDRHLKKFAIHLARLAPPGNLVARTGGDEFVVILVSSTKEDAFLLAESIIAMTKDLAGQIGADLGAVSIGISLGSEPWFQLLINSDYALYHAKRIGRARYWLYDVSTPRHSAERSLAAEVQGAYPR